MHQIEIPISNFKAAIFDMDGTMIVNMQYHKRAWQEFLKRHDINLSEEEFRRKISGKKNDQIFELAFSRQLSREELEKYAEEKEAIYRELYAPFIKEVHGLTSFVDNLHSRGIKTAIATTAPAMNREFALKSLGIQSKFEVILGDEHVAKGKPHPEIYLSAAQKMGIGTERCIAFEDSPPGVESAKNAGMIVVGLLTSHSRKELANADYYATDFSEIQLI